MRTIIYAGADLRAHPSLPDRSWSAARRSDYLLRPDVPRPLSVDESVWERLSEGDGPLPWIAPDDVQRRAGPSDACAVFGVVAEDASEAEALKEELGAGTPLEIDGGWSAAGFDVVDPRTGVSGLSNCGYGGEIHRLRRTWAALLNEYGLFSDVADALAFRTLTNQRVPEHAPFRVYGIWLVPRLWAAAPARA